MPVFALPPEHVFPDPRLARDDGLLAVGGDLHPHRLVLAYTMGIFPWYSEGQPILWHSPNPRFVLYPRELHLGRSLRKTLKKAPYTLRLDTRFADVIEACGQAPRHGQRGTWITREMRSSYVELHRQGLAHSVEAYEGDTLVGGLYGVALGSVFFGESMFARAPDASKIAFVTLVAQLVRWKFTLVDSQVYTDHLDRFGAREIPRDSYIQQLKVGLDNPTRRGVWAFETHLDPSRVLDTLTREAGTG